jgi:hypothetical protein
MIGVKYLNWGKIGLLETKKGDNMVSFLLKNTV